MNGTGDILQERLRQIGIHNISVQYDYENNGDHQLIMAAVALCMPPGAFLEMSNAERETYTIDSVPDGWNEERWRRMINDTYVNRLKKAGALIAAEIDRIKHALRMGEQEQLRQEFEA